MAEFDKIDQYIDEAALRKQTDFFLSLFKEIEEQGTATAEKIKNFMGADFSSKSTKAKFDSIKDLELTTSRYQKIMADLALNYEKLTPEQEKYLQNLNKEYIAQERARQGAQETVNIIQKEVQLEQKKTVLMEQAANVMAKNNQEYKIALQIRDRLAKVQAMENNSLGKAQAIIELLTAKKKQLNLSTDDGIKKNEAWNKAIEKQNAFILANADAETKRVKNIGNYQGSAKIIVDALDKEIAKLKELESQRVRATNLTNTGPRTRIRGFAATTEVPNISQLDSEIDRVKQSISGLQAMTDNPKFLNIASKTGDSVAELRFFTKALVDLERQGLGNTKAATELRKNLAKLTDQIADTRAEVKAMSSDTRGFDLFAGGVRAVTSAWQTASGVAEMYAGENEDVQKSIQKLVAIQNIAMGVQELANELTQDGTLLNKGYVVVQGWLSTAFDKSAASAARFNAALGLIGLAVTVIGGLVYAYMALTKQQGEAEIKQKLLKDAVEGANSEYQKAIETVSKLENELQLAKDGFIDKTTAVKHFTEQMGLADGSIKSVQDAENWLYENKDKYMQMMLQKAIATAAYSEAAKEAVKAQMQEKTGEGTVSGRAAGTILDAIGTSLFGVSPGAYAFWKKNVNSKSEIIANDNRDIANEANKRKDIFFKIAKDSEKESAILAQSLGIGKSTTGTGSKYSASKGSGKSDKISQLEKDAQAQMEILKLQNEQEANYLKQAYENENNAYAIRAMALQQYVEKKSFIINKEAEFEKSKKGLTANEVQLIEEKKNDDLIKLAEDAGNQLNDIHLKQVEKEKEIRKGILSNAETSLPTGMTGLMQSEIDKEIALKKEAHDIEIELIRQKKEAYNALYNAVGDTIKNVFLGAFEAQKNKLEDEDALIEKRRDREIQSVENSVLSEQEKADRISVINIKAQADKENIERRQKQIDERKARFERLFSSFDIAINTIQSVAKIKATILELTAKAVANPFLAPLIPLAASQLPIAIATGAAQMAALWATPIPKYKHGLSKDYEGLAIVGDGGKSEAITRTDGKIEFTPSKDTLTYIKKGDRIHPDSSEFLQSMQRSVFTEIPSYSESITTEIAFKDLQNEFKENKKYLKQIASKKELHLSTTKQGLSAMWQYGANQIKYINEQCNW